MICSLRKQPFFFAPGPSRETPLRPGAKKDGCFRRLRNLAKTSYFFPRLLTWSFFEVNVFLLINSLQFISWSKPPACSSYFSSSPTLRYTPKFCSSQTNLRSYSPFLYLDAGKEGMIHLLVGSYMFKNLWFVVCRLLISCHISTRLPARSWSENRMVQTKRVFARTSFLLCSSRPLRISVISLWRQRAV